MAYVSFPLIKDKKILLKIIIELKKAIAYEINAILQYEYLFKHIKLYKDPRDNFNTFLNHSAKRFAITPQEIKLIQELIDINEIYKQSTMEFTKDEKLIILTGDLTKKVISVQKIKEFILLSKTILKKAQERIKAAP